MRFWQKIFICTLLLFIVALNIASYILVTNNHRLNLQRERERVLNEYVVVRNSIQSEINYTGMELGLVFDIPKYVVQNALKNYALSYGEENVYFEVLELPEMNTLFSNFEAISELKERKELKNLTEGSRNDIIHQIGTGKYMFVSGLFDLDNKEYVFTYIRDITGIYTVRDQQVDFFLQLSLAISIAVAVIMIVITRWLTRSIKKLTNSTRIISRGIYNERVDVKSKDEIGELATNFNLMSEAVELNMLRFKQIAEEKQKFFENFTHEIKTPLTSVIGYADILRKAVNVDEKTMTMAANYIYSEGKRLESLSFKLMDLIMLQNEKPKLQPYNLMAVLKETEEILLPKLDMANIRLEMELIDITVDIEKDLFKTLVINLVDNAAKASKEGGRIRVSVRKDRLGRAVLEVRDWGRGIPQDELSKITAPFYMLDKARTRAEHGAGLGLSICGEIVNLHNAKMNITSEVGEGTCIEVTFWQSVFDAKND